MKHAVLLMLFCSACLLVHGCKSSLASASGETLVQTPAIPSGQGRIYLYRVSSTGGTAIRPSVILNDGRVGKAVPGEYTYVDRAPGNYVVSTSVLGEQSADFALAAGETKYVRLNAKFGIYAARIVPQVVTESTGKSAVAKCEYVPSTNPGD